MASHFDNFSNWRLKFVTDDGVEIPYKIINTDLTFTRGDASGTLTILIPATLLVDLLYYMLPPPLELGAFFVPQYRKLGELFGAGQTNIFVSECKVKGFKEDLPTDILWIDPDNNFGPDENTYNHVYEIELAISTYAQDSDPNNPYTFVEISSTNTVEVMDVNVPNAKFQRRQIRSGTTFGFKIGGPDGINWDQASDRTGIPVGEIKVNFPIEPDGDPEPLRFPIDSRIIIPLTEWTIKWDNIPLKFFEDTLVHRLRNLQGKVNAKIFPLLYDAQPETLLFESWDFSKSYTWRYGEDGRNDPAVDLEIKMSERRIFFQNDLVTWNHFWVPGKGFRYLYINDEHQRIFDENDDLIETRPGDTFYQLSDFNHIFKFEK